MVEPFSTSAGPGRGERGGSSLIDLIPPEDQFINRLITAESCSVTRTELATIYSLNDAVNLFLILEERDNVRESGRADY